MQRNYIEKLPVTWLEDKLRKIKLSWFGFSVLTALLVLMVETPHDLNPGLDNYIRTAVFDCFMVGYTFTSWAITKYFLVKCLKSLASLADDPKPEILKSSSQEWQYTFGIGFLLTLIANLNNYQFASVADWLNILAAFTAYSSFGWIVFAFLASAKQITQFILRISVNNVFNTTPFKSVAHWCLSAAAVIMGAITIASLFLGGNILTTANLITYGLAGSLGIFVFFAGMWSTHQHMQKNKDRELNHVNEQLNALHVQILESAKSGDLVKSRALMDVSAGLSTHKDRLDKIPSWPFTVGSLGGLASSITIPVVINILTKLF